MSTLSGSGRRYLRTLGYGRKVWPWNALPTCAHTPAPTFPPRSTRPSVRIGPSILGCKSVVLCWQMALAFPPASRMGMRAPSFLSRGKWIRKLRAVLRLEQGAFIPARLRPLLRPGSPLLTFATCRADSGG